MWCKLGDIAFVTKLAGFEYTNYIADNLSSCSGIPLFKGKNVKNGSIDYRFESFIPEYISNQLWRSQITKKCLLTPYVGAIGNIGIHDKEGKYHLGSNVGKIEVCSTNGVIVIEEFLRYYLMSSYGYRELSKHKKATAQESISIEAIRDVIIPICSLSMQKRIVESIEQWFSYIDFMDKQIIELNQVIADIKSKILDLAIHGKLVPQDPNDEPAIELLRRINPNFQPCDNAHYILNLPHSWELATIGAIFQHNTGKALNKADAKIGKLLPYITTSNVYWDYFELSEIKEMYFKDSEIDKCTVRKGDLLICEGGDVGRSAIWPFDYNICIQNHIHRLRAKDKTNHRFYLYVIMLYKWTGKIQGKGIGLQGISSSMLDKLIIPVPPHLEQLRIVAKIEELFATLDKIRESLEV